MGWATYLTTQLTYNRKSYNNRYEVENDLEEARNYANSLKSKLKSLAMITEPKKWFADDSEEAKDPLMAIQFEVDNCLRELDETLYDIFKLEILLEDWDKCHDKETGLGKEEPKDFGYETAYISGDFVRTDKHPMDDNYYAS